VTLDNRRQVLRVVRRGLTPVRITIPEPVFTVALRIGGHVVPWCVTAPRRPGFAVVAHDHARPPPGGTQLALAPCLLLAPPGRLRRLAVHAAEERQTVPPLIIERHQPIRLPVVLPAGLAEDPLVGDAFGHLDRDVDEALASAEVDDALLDGDE